MPDRAPDALGELLAEAAGSDGCPVCRVLARSLYDAMCRLQYDAVHDPPTRQRLRAGGLCAAHVWYLFDLTTAHTTATLLAPLLAQAGEQARALAARLTADATLLRCGQALLARSLGPAACLACTDLGRWNDLLASTIARALAGGPVPPLAAGLCVTHLGRVVAQLPADTAAAVLDAWGCSAQALAARVEAAARQRGRARRAAAEAVVRLAGGRVAQRC
jgi:hypothetical protein